MAMEGKNDLKFVHFFLTYFLHTELICSEWSIIVYAVQYTRNLTPFFFFFSSSKSYRQVPGHWQAIGRDVDRRPHKFCVSVPREVARRCKPAQSESSGHR